MPSFTTTIENGIAVVSFDLPGEPVNKLNAAVKTELEALLGRLREDPLTRAVVLISGKADTFIAGADIEEFTAIGTQTEAERLSFEGQETVSRLETFQKPIVAAIDGVCAGAGAILAMASDLRLGTARAKIAFLFNRVGLAGCDMGACAILPRIIGQGRAAELLYTGRTMTAAEGERWGFYNRLVDAAALEADALDLAARIVSGPTFAHGITKTQLNQEWSMGLDQAIEAEAQAQAICMQTRDFERAYKAFVAKGKPVFEGN